MSAVRDEHVQEHGRRWQFDAAVTANFGAMLGQSIPGLQDMRRFTDELALRQLAGVQNPRILDIGASRGDAVVNLREQLHDPHLTLCEVSAPMLEELQKTFGPNNPNVEYVSADLSEDVSWMTRRRPFDLALSVLTLMFVPMENRQQLVQSIHDALRPGGAFIVVEKTIGNDPHTQRLLVDTYHDFKRGSGYTDEVIERKRMSLKGALVPCKESWTTDMLRDAGFVSIQSYWRALQFVGWICFKRT